MLGGLRGRFGVVDYLFHVLNVLGSFIKKFVTNAVYAVAAILAALVLGFLAAIAVSSASKSSRPGDRIAEEARESFVGVVVSVDEGDATLMLSVETEAAVTREVVVTEVGLVPGNDPALAAWRAKSLSDIRRLLVGSKVWVFSAYPTARGMPTYAHVAYGNNKWLNGSLVEDGLCYTLKMDPAMVVAGPEMLSLEREARIKKRGCWEFVTRDQFARFPRHY